MTPTVNDDNRSSGQERSGGVEMVTSFMEGVSLHDNVQQQQQQTATTTATTATTSCSTTDRIETIDMSDSEQTPVTAGTSVSGGADSPIPSAPVFLATPQANDVRPWDDLGRPSLPVEFDRQPRQIDRARRDTVLCFIPQTQSEQMLQNVLMQDYGNEMDMAKSLKQAYWPIPHKRPIKTIMGHVEICLVLERCKKDDEEEDDDDEDEDEDIVFELTQKRVAVKVCYSEVMDRLRKRHAEDPLKEIAAMQLLGDSHEHVLGCMQVLFDTASSRLNVVMRYCDSGDLFELLNSGGGLQQQQGMSEGRARFWFRQVVSGLQYLAQCEICHRDLSPENVMIDRGRACLIIDFGMCLRIPYIIEQDDEVGRGRDPSVYSQRRRRRCLIQPQGACGKLPYMAPEIFKNRKAFDGQAIDIWSAGTILFCMLTGNRSYQQPTNSDPQYYWMTHGLELLLRDWNVTLSPEGLHLLQNMLQVDPRLRLTLTEVVNHPWFTAAPDDPPPPTTTRR